VSSRSADRRPVGFTDAEVDLLQAFANQAAIAVDNARLPDRESRSETPSSRSRSSCRRRPRRCCGSSARTPGDLTTVLEGIGAKARLLCDAEGSVVLLRTDDVLRIVALDGIDHEYEGPTEFPGGGRGASTNRARDNPDAGLPRRHPRIGTRPRSALASTAARRRFATFASVAPVPGRRVAREPQRRPLRGTGRSDPSIGPILQAFADQASIAIANAQLFKRPRRPRWSGRRR